MISYDANVGNQDNWQFQNLAFLAWTDVQEFTVPFYQLISNNDDIIVLPAVNGTPPAVSGFTNQGIVGYAYSTEVCGSVPLLTAVNAGATDHWWTTNANDHTRMIASGTGWVDGGVPFFVLPLGTSVLSFLE